MRSPICAISLTNHHPPHVDINLNNILDITNTNRPTSLDLSNEDNFSNFGTPLNTLEAPKTPNILQNGGITAAKPPQNPELCESFSQKKLRMVMEPVPCLQLFLK
jgi:hypothetical protein